MNKITIGLIGYGVVGSGVVKLLNKRKKYIRDKFQTECHIRTLCDRSIDKKDTSILENCKLTNDYREIINDPDINVVLELIGGLQPARQIVEESLKKGKHVVTANKELIANCGKELFQLAKTQGRHLYFESSVGAGMPIIQMLTEGLAGNTFYKLYGIINGTCNFILTEMSKKNLTFAQALEEAQRRGYAESNPTLDISGMDSAHKLAILVYLAFGKFIKVNEIYTEGISHISHDDIEHAESLNLTIKLLAIAKRENDELEAHVHPTLISKDHPLASINGVYNGVYLTANPLGDLLLSGEGAGQMTAASGVLSDLLNLASRGHDANLHSNLYSEAADLKIRKIDQSRTRFYLRFMAIDKPGVLSKLTGVLGKHDIGINSVTQKAHNRAAAVPVVMLTDYTTEKNLRMALNDIQRWPIIKSKPVAIRMETLA
ncbi:MAG TPA: homoserine dehydrogenase [Candidatus Omnitrophota bacterium]|nr:homoserine dehydrogenase [Candidatus Omnitrophota bacterium]